MEFTDHIIYTSKNYGSQKSEWKGIQLLRKFARTGILKYQKNNSESHEKNFYSSRKYICISVHKMWEQEKFCKINLKFFKRVLCFNI